MAKVTIKAKVKIDQADYEKIMEFSQRDDSEQSVALRDLDALLGVILIHNFKGILAQIAAVKAQEQTAIGAKVALYGPDGKPLIVPPTGGSDAPA